jgi:hypothetical protein
MKKLEMIILGIVVVILVGALVTACAPPSGMVINDMPNASSSISIETVDSGMSIYRLTDKTNHIICYLRAGDGISCVKTQ